MKPPAQLFKYFSADSGLRFLQTGRLRFTQPDVFNDPFELRPFVRFSSQVFVSQHLEQNFETMMRKLYDENPAIALAGMPFDLFRAYANSKRADVAQAASDWLPYLDQVIRQEMTDMWAKHVGILCLAEDPLNLLMWAHYASSHTGICIGFDSAAEFFNRKRSSVPTLTLDTRL